MANGTPSTGGIATLLARLPAAWLLGHTMAIAIVKHCTPDAPVTWLPRVPGSRHRHHPLARAPLPEQPRRGRPEPTSGTGQPGGGGHPRHTATPAHPRRQA